MKVYNEQHIGKTHVSNEGYENERLANMLFWLESIDDHLHIDRRAYEGMKVIYEEYKKEKDDLVERIASEPSANKQLKSLNNNI